jgi:hypothetical protein
MCGPGRLDESRGTGRCHTGRVLTNEQGPGLSLKYNKCYIGLQRDGVPDNFIAFRPRKKHMNREVRIDRNEELDARLEESGTTLIPYDKRWQGYRFQLAPGDLKAQKSLITDLIRMARDLPVHPLGDLESDSAWQAAPAMRTSLQDPRGLALSRDPAASDRR